MHTILDIVSTFFYNYHRVDTSADGLLVPECITRSVVSAPVLAWLILKSKTMFLIPMGSHSSGEFNYDGSIIDTINRYCYLRIIVYGNFSVAISVLVEKARGRI